ncbi:50S ribosomal protein L24 [Nitrosomonas sp.]|jgi:large subunit ribosomal protein L24|uniref:50S ribosomal protein L24 n=1 Tax=Nitrosomonas sp. TaxID=42353 RepID=UPI0025E9C54D|nr:50S ribosomal protein L24 [Nitrosomonas sp.]MBS0586718.1 50S ribosomal protein L24 [Pseudomonadota bacterium]MBV6448392.1 50S ribosomal protein L24 [Nitrosomonas sp.]
MRKIRKGDDVVVIAGKDKGKRGVVLRAIKTDRLIIQGINLVKKHQKPNPATGVTGGITNKESSIHVSNVAIYNFTSKKADRVGFKLSANNRVRIFKSTNEQIEE